MAEQGRITVRQFRPGDKAQVDAIFKESMYAVILWPLLRHCLKQRRTWIALVLLTALVHRLLGLLGDLAAGALALLGSWAFAMNAIRGYLATCYKEDMKDIMGHYVKAEGGNFWVAELEGQGVVGMVAVEKAEDGWAELRRMSVDKRVRGLGIGRKLVEALLAFCRAQGYPGVKLSTTQFMVAAHQLYARCGMQLDYQKDVPLGTGYKMQIWGYRLAFSTEPANPP